MLNIGGLTEGVVLDHIKAGGSMAIYNYLNLEKLDCSVAIIKNACSNKMGKKDIIKIEGIPELDLDMIAVLDPTVTINIIRNGKIAEKRSLRFPMTVTGIIKCKNPRCITSVETALPHTFKLADPEKGIYRCMYCEQAFKRN
ncbi:MAG: aspartate carbamoyltransferase regulatory subunit [Lachnospiraceae bacterium]|nr:aspartate carbamoyltransferase regulatory subunit [Lachnospiraceae bacterium]